MFSLVFIAIPVLFCFLHFYYSEKARKNPFEKGTRSFKVAIVFTDLVLALCIGFATFIGMFFYHLILYPVRCSME